MKRRKSKSLSIPSTVVFDDLKANGYTLHQSYGEFAEEILKEQVSHEALASIRVCQTRDEIAQVLMKELNKEQVGNV